MTFTTDAGLARRWRDKAAELRAIGQDRYYAQADYMWLAAMYDRLAEARECLNVLGKHEAGRAP